VSRTTQAQGATFEDALAAAIAELAGADRDQVELELGGVDLGELSGRVRLDLDVSSPADEDQGEPSPEKAPADADEDRDASDDEITAEDLDEEADAAADFLEGLLDAMDLPGDLRIHLHGDHAEVEIIDLGSGALIGRRGQTLESIQELLRCAMQRQFQRRCRVKVDAEGYRARRLEKLIEKAEDAIDDVLDTGEAVRLEPMDVFERKAIHNLVAQNDGVDSRSQGREPARRVVIEPTD
jgi:spoIIIJ-associated protein